MSRNKRKNLTPKVLIVDDHPAVREALAIRIAQTGKMEVCGEAADEVEALQACAKQQPDIAVVDITLRSGDGLDLIKRLKARHPQIRVLVWSMHSESTYAERALRSGADGYITKQHATQQIIRAIQQVLTDKLYLSPAMTEKFLHRLKGAGGERLDLDPIESLSDRELEVLRLIGQGTKTTRIAAQLHLSVKTIETYRDRIRQKLHWLDGNELMRYAVQWTLQNV